MSDETPDHYFTAQPASPDERRTLSVVLDSQPYEVETAGGIFSPGRIDLGTSVLLRTVSDPPTGDVLDLGCGWGPITLTMALQNRQATVWGVDVNERALDLLRRNAEKLGLSNVRAVRPEEVPDDVRLAAIWSNPPIRVGKDELHSMLDTWLPRLLPGSSAYLVVQRNLGADSLQGWMASRYGAQGDFRSAQGPFTATVTKLASAKGFRVIEVIRD
ncbi:Methyltransferase small domain-containing protein [Sanguibacter gelidistatuariae]|uniref:Methyltransferase small domain-containing protein n=1 Tax=Sanguibacter gelidistatuariae TaxID=1814289 RepID=A0A1G6NTV5_9MICO|nr:methyltransferase [Sanguibacter gelidistatuariae]SDC71363.1 Methyltransferase small domain-containing protein [Sanguibacter gelidistatuariae]